MSLKFLNLKGWHPANKANQKRIWIAEQTAKDKEQREREAAAEVRKDADTRHYQEIAAARGDEDAARRMSSQQVGFLYAPPPGLLKDKEQETRERPDTEDEAVREFRRKVEKRGEGDAQRKLERYVGRRAEDPLTIKDQVERFPILKDAPVEGGYTDSVRVNFKPMGLQLRNVKCIRCGQWGHQSGDRECKLRDQNPHDPVTEINKLKSSKQELVLRRAALPLEMQGEAMGGEFEILQSDDGEKRMLGSFGSTNSSADVGVCLFDRRVDRSREGVPGEFVGKGQEAAAAEAEEAVA
ncbi:hypothetical protein BBJ28_00023704 [Nothophytophthora sp. Chile5]|nr:hypothetical protein BBJ28_00023704 [Nothophytophthora sp. Chile5]